ncbi:MAG: glycosyl hydrolase, partial [Acidobacteriota bacterium]
MRVFATASVLALVVSGLGRPSLVPSSMPRWANGVPIYERGAPGAAAVVGQTAGRTPGIADVQRLFRDPPDDSRIMMRWWWFGPAATREELDAELRHMKEGGIGGFEVAVVYPLEVDDASSGFHNYPYLSAEFLDTLAYASRRAHELGLRMDLTIGSGWPFGGPHITPALAASRLRSERREIASGVTSIPRQARFEDDALVAAFIGAGSAQEADP